MPSSLQLVEQMRVERLAAHVHRLGPRATAEAFAELARTSPRVASVLAEYQRITPAMLHVTGGDRFVRHVCDVPR